MEQVILGILSNYLNFYPNFDISTHFLIEKLSINDPIYLIIREKNNNLEHSLYLRSDLSIIDIENVQEGLFEASANNRVQILRREYWCDYKSRGFSFIKKNIV